MNPIHHRNRFGVNLIHIWNPNKKNPILSTFKINNKCVKSKKDLLFHYSKVFTVSHDDKSVHDFPLISESQSLYIKHLILSEISC